MAVSLNAVMAAGNNGDAHAVSATTSFTATDCITVAAGSDIVLIVAVAWGQNSGGTVPSSRAITVGGSAATERAFLSSGAVSPIESVGLYVFVLGTSSGAKTIAGSWSGSLDCYVFAVAWNGADQTTGIATADTATSASNAVTVTNSSDGATVAVNCRNGSVAAPAQTVFGNHDALNPGATATYVIGTAGSDTHNYANGSNQGTANNRVSAGVHVIASAGGAAATRGTPFGHRGTAFNGGRIFQGIINRSGLIVPNRKLIIARNDPRWRAAA